MNRLRIGSFIILAIILSSVPALASEEPKYTVLKSYDQFELRQYEPLLVAEVRVTADFKEVGSQAFRSLFGFISEDDRPQGKIAMTAPVLQQPLPGDEPSQPADKTYRFAFVMPAQYSLDDLPQPEDGDINIRSVPSRVLAVRRYSGTWSEELYRENEKVLLDALQTEEFSPIGAPIFARYNAPFSLWFMRRNEVLIEVNMLMKHFR